MKLGQVLKKYPERYVIAQPLLRDVVTARALTFNVLNSCWNVQDAVKKMEYYVAEGFKEVFILPCQSDKNDLPPSLVAKMFRIIFGKEAE